MVLKKHSLLSKKGLVSGRSGFSLVILLLYSMILTNLVVFMSCVRILGLVSQASAQKSTLCVMVSVKLCGTFPNN